MTMTATWTDLIVAGRKVEDHHPWPRLLVGEEAWRVAIEGLAAMHWTLSGLWGDEGAVHMALLHGTEMAVLSLECPQGHFPSVGRHHPPAIRLERAICDLYGFAADGALDTRPWLDHGQWGQAHPLGAQRENPAAEPYAFLTAEGESLHQIPVGPVHAGIIEPGHFRFHANGESVVRLEARLGYTHKGVESLMRGASLKRTAQTAGRVSGDRRLFLRVRAPLTGFKSQVEQ